MTLRKRAKTKIGGAEPGTRGSVAGSTEQDGTSGDVADRELLGRVAAREPEALDAFYERYQARAYAVALRITGEAGLAEDVVQEAFIQAWRNAGRYSSSIASVKAWLLSIVHHRAVDAVRSRRTTAKLPDGEDIPQALVLPDVWPEVSRRLDRAAVQRALKGLSSVQREAIELAYFGGLSQGEIARRTAIPLGTVKSRVRDALIAMRRALGVELGLAGSQGTV